MNRVVITGIGILVPSGSGAEEFWRNNTAGRGFLRREPLMEQMGLKSRAVSSIDGFELSDHHGPQDAAELAELSRFVQLSVTAGAMAALDSGLDSAEFDADRAGVVLASAIGGTPEFQVAFEKNSDAGTVPLRPFPTDFPFYDSVFLNYAPAWLARRFGLRGPSSTLTTGCTAGLDALGLAFEQVRHGELDIVLAGAGEAPLSGLAYATLDVIGSLSVADGPPETASRPFDAKRAGFVLGEGAASIVLEEYEHAVARNAPIYGEVLGFASANNAFHMSDLAPDGKSMAAVMSEALRDAAVAPEEIDYINAHGSSTPQNDVFETQAIKSALGTKHASAIPISSTKSMIGHSLASASMVGTVAALGALRYSVVPPTVNYEFPDPACDLDYVPNKARAHDTRTAMVTASGFGGIHSSAVLRRVGEPIYDRYIHDQASPAHPTGHNLVTTEVRAGGTALVTGGPNEVNDVLLLLHGFAGTARHWESIMEYLPPCVTAIAVDLPGHGSNTMAIDTPLPQVHDYLNDVLDQLAPDRKVVVFGHSLGGLVALDFARANASRVAGAGVLGSGTRAQLNPRLVRQLVDGELDEPFLRASVSDPNARQARQLVVDGFRGLRLSSDTTDVWGLRNQDLATGLGVPPMPLLVLAAANDRVVAVRKTAALAKLLPGAKFAGIDNADHYVHLEDPLTVLSLLTGLLITTSLVPPSFAAELVGLADVG